MGIFDDLSGSIANTTRDLGKFAQNASDMTKLQYDKKVKEGELIKLYEKLGKKYYEEHKDELSGKRVYIGLKDLECSILKYSLCLLMLESF